MSARETVKESKRKKKVLSAQLQSWNRWKRFTAILCVRGPVTLIVDSGTLGKRSPHYSGFMVHEVRRIPTEEFIGNIIITHAKRAQAIPEGWKGAMLCERCCFTARAM